MSLAFESSVRVDPTYRFIPFHCPLVLSHGSFHSPLLARHSTSVKGVITVRSGQLISEFSSQPLACMAFGVVLILALTAGCAPLFAQGFSVENRSAPSVVGAGTFVSLEGK